MLVEPISGKPLSDPSKNTKLLYYLKGTEPKESDPTFDEIGIIINFFLFLFYCIKYIILL